MDPSTEVQKRNVEIKARIADDAAFDKCIRIAKKLTNTDGAMLDQRDVFYNANSGRLKLRMEVRFCCWFVFILFYFRIVDCDFISFCVGFFPALER